MAAFLVAALEAVGSHQNLILWRLPRHKTLLHGHGIGEANGAGGLAGEPNGVGGVAFSLMWGRDIQTPSSYQKLTLRPFEADLPSLVT